MYKIALPIALIASFLPIWRVPGRGVHGKGACFWEYCYDFLGKEVDHVPIEEAIESARRHYLWDQAQQ